MKITIEESDRKKAKRLIACDDAFSLLFQIDQECRSAVKYDSKESKEDFALRLREMIHEENLLELYE